MSSDIDMKDKNARLQVQLEVLQQDSAARIRELEQNVIDLKIENRLLQDPSPQPAAPTGSSDPVLGTEISQLQQALVTKDVEIASKDAIIARRHRILSDLIKSMTSYESSLDDIARNIHRTKDAAAAEIDQLPTEKLTSKIHVTDTDRSSKPASSSLPRDAENEGETTPKTPSSNLAPNDVSSEDETEPKTTPSSSPTKGSRGEGEIKPQTPLFDWTPTKVPADAAIAPSESAKPNFFQGL